MRRKAQSKKSFKDGKKNKVHGRKFNTRGKSKKGCKFSDADVAICEGEKIELKSHFVCLCKDAAVTTSLVTWRERERERENAFTALWMWM